MFRTSTILMALLTGSFFCPAQNLLTIQNGGKLYIQSNASGTVHGSVSLQNGSLIALEGTLTQDHPSSTGVSSWTDQTATAYSHGSGRLILSGSGGHTASTPNSFGRIDLNSPDDLTITRNLTCGKLYLETGLINTGGTNYVVVTGTAANAVEAAPSNSNFTNSWINGNLRRYISPAAVNEYEFPVGNSSKPYRSALTNLNASPLTGTSYINASFGPKPGTDLNLVATEGSFYYVSVNSGGVWYLTPDVQPTGGTYDVKLFFNDFTGLLDNEFAILKRSTASSDAADWEVPSGSTLNNINTPGRTLAGGYALRKGISSFSQFGIGHRTPIVLNNQGLSLTAQRISSTRVHLTWHSLQEPNGTYYQLERSSDQVHFIPVGTTLNRETVQLHGRTYEDFNHQTSNTYYRIKQFFSNGQMIISPVRRVFGTVNEQIVLQVSPNPSRGTIRIEVSGNSVNYICHIRRSNGQLVRSLTLEAGIPQWLHNLPNGSYLIDAYASATNTHLQPVQFIIEH